ncbi:MAG: hypothetical protein ABFD97_13365 [Syntrophobacter sp.]
MFALLSSSFPLHMPGGDKTRNSRVLRSTGKTLSRLPGALVVWASVCLIVWGAAGVCPAFADSDISRLTASSSGATAVKSEAIGVEPDVSVTPGPEANLTAATSAGQAPVVVVPGILGSLSSCLFVDPASGKPCPAGFDFHYLYGLQTIHLTPEWILDPIGKTYDSLVEELQYNGFTVYPAPYDWRSQNSITASRTLADITARARLKSGSEKVDIVAHSMGGLVTRSYIEQLGMSDVGKFVMLGTPNRGSQDAYYVWEGGNLSVFGKLEGSAFVNPLIKDMKVGYGRGSISTCKFIQNNILSARDLLPIDNYLVRGSGKVVDVNKMYWRNDLIPNLDYAGLISTLGIDNIRIFAGTGIATIKNINVTGKSTALVYKDGTPVSNVMGAGDGTVLQRNAKLGDIAVTRKAGVGHGDLPDVCRNDIVGFLRGVEGATLESQHNAARASSIRQRSRAVIRSLLFAGTTDKIHMGITTAEGLRVGRFTARETTADFENYYYRGNDDETAAIGIYNPSRKTHVLTVTTGEPMVDFVIYLSFTDKTGEKMHELKGTIGKGSIIRYSISLEQGLNVF